MGFSDANCPKQKNLFYKHANYLVILVLLSFPQTSGLSTWIGRQMLSLSSLPYWAVTLLACILVSLVTEFVSNPATITIFLPILCSMVSENSDIFSLSFYNGPAVTGEKKSCLLLYDVKHNAGHVSLL